MFQIQCLNSKMEHQYLANLKIKSFNTKILMLIPKGEHHTYGGIAATRKLRGLGTEPFLTLDYKKEEFSISLDTLIYDAFDFKTKLLFSNLTFLTLKFS